MATRIGGKSGVVFVYDGKTYTILEWLDAGFGIGLNITKRSLRARLLDPGTLEQVINALGHEAVGLVKQPTKPNTAPVKRSTPPTRSTPVTPPEPAAKPKKSSKTK